MRFSFFLLLGTLLLLPAAPARSAEAPPPAGFAELLAELRGRGAAAGVSAPTLAAVFASVRYVPRAVESDRNRPETQMVFAKYLQRHLSEKRRERVAAQWAEHRAAVAAASGRFGIEAPLLVALWGIETNCGLYKGSYPVFDALATLALDGRRRTEFFKKEFIAALRVLDGGHVPLAEMRGSWAGAQGHTQFMPSTFLALAVDGDGDGKKDVWNNPADALASGANYLKALGWAPGETWYAPVELPETVRERLLAAAEPVAATELAAAGVAVPPELAHGRGYLLAPDGPQGAIYYVGANVRRLLKWNRSTYFALTVAHLAQTYAPLAPPPALEVEAKRQ